MNQLFLQNLVFVLFLKIKYNMTRVLNDNFILIHDGFWFKQIIFRNGFANFRFLLRLMFQRYF